MDDFIKQIAKCLVKDIETESKNWESITYLVSCVTTYQTEQLSYNITNQLLYATTSGDDEIEGALFSTKQLHQAMYEQEPSKGAWYSMTMEINKEGKFKVDFNYDDKPDFGTEIDEERYFVDFQAYPREEQYIPQWLKDIIKKYQK